MPRLCGATMDFDLFVINQRVAGVMRAVGAVASWGNSVNTDVGGHVGGFRIGNDAE